MSYDVGIVGGGIVGSAIAREVALRKGRGVVVDTDRPVGQATWAAAGMLSPQAEAKGPGAFLDLLLQARDLYPAFVAELEERTGIGLGYRTEGAILVAITEEDEVELEKRLHWQRELGLDLESLTGVKARRLEPALSAKVRSALYFPGDHQIENRLLGKALSFAAAALGAEFRVGAAVQKVKVDPRPTLEMADGTTIEAETIVIAAGSWSGTLLGMPRTLPVEPVHGQLMSVTAVPPVFRHIAVSPRGYVVPRSDGRIIVGTTVERIGFRPKVTPVGLQRLAGIAVEIAPFLGNLPVEAHWSGFRPGTPDGLPILGPDPDEPRVIYATGHFRNGILLGPLTGQLIAAIALGESASVDLKPFAIDRFPRG
ncbi:MAG: glycine oxidase ThiO [Gemmatimonas sp.]|nr:glycine oxidase ThiO [Gemmatimonas sp.]